VSQQQAEPSQKNATVMHATLLGGTAVIAAVFTYLVYVQTGALLDDGTVVGYALAGVSVVVQLVAWMILRPRVVPRPATMSEVEYWLDPNRFGAAMLLWVVAEGATIIALVGWLLSGNISSMVLAAVGIGLLVMYRPGVLAGR